MNEDDLINRLRTLIREEIETALDKALAPIKQTLSEHTKFLEEHTDKIDALTAEAQDIHQQTGAIWDKISLTYERNKREIDEIKDHLGLAKLPHISEA